MNIQTNCMAMVKLHYMYDPNCFAAHKLKTNFRYHLREKSLIQCNPNSKSAEQT